MKHRKSVYERTQLPIVMEEQPNFVVKLIIDEKLYMVLKNDINFKKLHDTAFKYVSITFELPPVEYIINLSSSLLSPLLDCIEKIFYWKFNNLSEKKKYALHYSASETSLANGLYTRSGFQQYESSRAYSCAFLDENQPKNTTLSTSEKCIKLIVPPHALNCVFNTLARLQIQDVHINIFSTDYGQVVEISGHYAFKVIDFTKLMIKHINLCPKQSSHQPSGERGQSLLHKFAEKNNSHLLNKLRQWVPQPSKACLKQATPATSAVFDDATTAVTNDDMSAEYHDQIIDKLTMLQIRNSTEIKPGFSPHFTVLTLSDAKKYDHLSRLYTFLIGNLSCFLASVKEYFCNLLNYF